MRFNGLHLYGLALEGPQIAKDAGVGMVRLAVMRAPRPVYDRRDPEMVDVVKVMTRNPDILESMEKIQRYDMVEVEGLIRTGNLIKTSFCSHCGSRNERRGVIAFAQPKQIRVMGHVKDKNEGRQELIASRECSNQVRILGTLTRDVSYGQTLSGIKNASYTIASDRLYREKDDTEEDRTVYPTIVEYGQNAEDAKAHIHMGTGVFIDGCIQSRRVHRKGVCQKCGKGYEWYEEAVEIVSYNTSYLYGYLNDEDVEEEKRLIAEKNARRTKKFLETYLVRSGKIVSGEKKEDESGEED